MHEVAASLWGKAVRNLTKALSWGIVTNLAKAWIRTSSYRQLHSAHVAGKHGQRLEDQHIQRNRKSINKSTSSSSESNSTEETDGAVSTSEDSVYWEEFEPEFDLMKSMLRASYGDSKAASKLKKKAVEEKDKVEKNVELEEVFQNKVATRKVELIGGGDVEEEVKGKDGPRFKDLGGMGGVLEELKMEVIVPLFHPQLPRWLGVRPMAGILLHGPPGCGKTKLAHAVANETGVPFYKISAIELVSGVSGGSEENIRDLFAKAYRTAPSIVFIDEIDAIASKRENLQREMERRIVTQLMTCMDESYRFVQPADAEPNAESSNIRPGYVLVIGATNRPDAVDPALRRPGRFD
ncbi:hypothetical protein Vadar_009910 [Vaccinium darrowii]|uniref:Uncharacterized protein n=1 Tax=Vaccinium darrowii TaxID=229202 RepID=A0ACB7WZH6_9ERIC|nr:hypothetical protein Vadar_009910 [Vaccinium darrowii]